MRTHLPSRSYDCNWRHECKSTARTHRPRGICDFEVWYGNRPFLARYTADGEYRWARVLDPDLGNLQLGALPGGATLFGGAFNSTVEVEAMQFGPSQGTDALLLKLAP